MQPVLEEEITNCCPTMENKKENLRERSEEIKKKVIAKCGQCKGYKIISKELHVPETTIAKYYEEVFLACEVEVNVSGCGRERKIGSEIDRTVEREPRKTPAADPS